MDYQQDFATESTQTTTDPKRRYLCRHIFTDGHRCGSPALRRQPFCYYHRLARPSVSNEGRPTIFQMPPIGDRPAIHNAIFEVLTRAAGATSSIAMPPSSSTACNSPPTTSPAWRARSPPPNPWSKKSCSTPTAASSPHRRVPRTRRQGRNPFPRPVATELPGAPCQTASPSDAGMYPATSGCHPERSLALAPNAVEGP